MPEWVFVGGLVRLFCGAAAGEVGLFGDGGVAGGAGIWGFFDAVSPLELGANRSRSISRSIGPGLFFLAFVRFLDRVVEVSICGTKDSGSETSCSPPEGATNTLVWQWGQPTCWPYMSTVTPNCPWHDGHAKTTGSGSRGGDFSNELAGISIV